MSRILGRGEDPLERIPLESDSYYQQGSFAHTSSGRSGSFQRTAASPAVPPSSIYAPSPTPTFYAPSPAPSFFHPPVAPVAPPPAAYVYPAEPSAPLPPPLLAHEESKPSWVRTFPWVTTAIVTACVILFIVTMAVNDCPSHPHPYGEQCVFPWLGPLAFEPLNVNPMFGPTADTLLNMGGLNANYIVYFHQGWRLLTCMWLHAGVIHIVCNLIGIGYLAKRIEQDFGHLKLAVLYFLTGVSGATMSALFMSGNSVGVGASGALFGLVGASLAELLMNWDLYTNRACALFTLVMLIVINLLIGLMPYIDNFAHIGGCLSGFLLGFVLLVKPQRGYVDVRSQTAAAAVESGAMAVTSRNTPCQTWTRVVAGVIFLAMFGTGLGVLLSGQTVQNCKWCSYFTCVPTSLWSCDGSQSGSNTGGQGPVCQALKYENGTGILKCANNKATTFQNLTSYDDYGLRVLCTQTCS